jgi:hypothetical protein
MKIRKTDIPGLDTKAKIEAALEQYREDEDYRANVGNKEHAEHPKIRELYLHIQNGGSWTYTAKTLEQEQETERIEAEKEAEQKKQDRILLAKTDGTVRDLLITELMNESGFTPDKITLAQTQESKDGKDMSQFWSDRSSKLTEIKTMIADA